MRSVATGTALFLILIGAHARTVRAQGVLRSVVHAAGFSLPVAVVQDPTNPSVQFVVQQRGRIRTVQAGGVLPTDFLNLSSVVSSSGGERGLLGMVFAPDYATSRRFYVNFTDTSGHTVVARFRSSNDPLVADAASRFDLRWNGAAAPALIEQPYANHNGGHLAFGPDGYLYVGLGDGGSANDPQHRAQNPAELLGKMLRIDVSVPEDDPIGYRVPANNPFVASGPAGTRREIWAFGLRNPWRYSFDDISRGGTGALVIGDVGQGALEEIDYEPRAVGGRNYGWRNREGNQPTPNVGNEPPAYGPLTEPIHVYGRTEGASVTGGYVYRGRALGPSFVGRYFFADYVSGRVWSLRLAIGAGGEATASDLQEHTAALDPARLGQISSFGIDAGGDLFILSYNNGTLLRVLGDPQSPDPPSNLRIIR
jgi:glucose/arabinose dehydrogenase